MAQEQGSPIVNLFLKAVDFFFHLDRYLSAITSQYGTWTYGILFLVIFCETGLVVTPFLPGDSLLFAIGSLAAIPESNLNIFLILLLLPLAAITGDLVNYSIGRRLGEKAYEMNSRWIKKKYLDKTRDFFKKHGGKTIIIARFMPIIRTFTPFVAGIAKMKFSYFISFSIFGGLFWVLLFTLGGYFFGNIPFVKSNFSIVI